MEELLKEINRPADILVALGCDPAAAGFDDFVELCHRIRAKWRDPDGKRAVLCETVTEMCRVRETFQRAFYQKIKRAVRPVLDADAETLAAFGISLKKRTSSELAYCLAQIFEKYGS